LKTKLHDFLLCSINEIYIKDLERGRRKKRETHHGYPIPMPSENLRSLVGGLIYRVWVTIGRA
jgi:hypothetical protein